MHRNRIDLRDMGMRQNKKFMKSLHKASLEDTVIWFDRLDCEVSIQRRPKPEMDLKKFTSLMKKDNIQHIKLQIGEIYKGMREDNIEHDVSVSIYPEPYHRISEFAWLRCPYTQHNYDIVSKLFEAAYGRRLESVEVPDYLKPYYAMLEK
jgi:hypothetical protein